MRKAVVILSAAILISLVFLSELSCAILAKSSFASLEEKTTADRLPMSDTDPGLYHQYRTTVSFRDGQFFQQESDYFFTGPYDCKFGMIVARPFSGGSISGSYNPFSHTLLWNGESYRQN